MWSTGPCCLPGPHGVGTQASWAAGQIALVASVTSQRGWCLLKMLLPQVTEKPLPPGREGEAHGVRHRHLC